MSESDIRGMFQSPKQSKQPHKIVFSHNMKIQGFTEPKQQFKNYKQAYLYGIAHYGSGSFENRFPTTKTPPSYGWDIRMI